MNCSRKNYKVVESKNLKIGDKILTAEGSLSIRKINAVGHKNCYDISIIRKLDDSFMKEPNFILSNGIVSHNCNLQIVNDAHSLVKKRRGVDIDWDNVDLDDKFVYDNVVHHHDHYGVFQYECLDKDTMVEGKTIEEWYIDGKPDHLISYNEESNKFIKNECLAVIKSGKKKLYEIELEDGKTIKASEDHKFLTKAGWKALKELTEEDEILTTNKYIKIKKIEEKEFGETYDIAMKSPHNNFIANNMVVHNSGLAKRLMRDILPDNFEDLSAVSSLLRPGPLRMGMHTEFADRKHGRKIEGRDYEIPECIRDIIGYTYGIIVYQEEFMEIAHKIGGLDRAETNAFRKALVKYGKGAEQEAKRYSQVESYHNKFIENACKPEFLGDKLKAEELWDLIASFAAYGFNKSISSDEMVEDKTRGTISLEMVNRLVKFGQKIQVKSTDKNENIIWVDVNDVHDHGILDLVEVELEDGKKIKCTLDHKFRTSEGMIPLHDILERDLEIITEEELCKKQ